MTLAHIALFDDYRTLYVMQCILYICSVMFSNEQGLPHRHRFRRDEDGDWRGREVDAQIQVWSRQSGKIQCRQTTSKHLTCLTQNILYS